MLCRMEILSVAEQLPRLLLVQGMSQMQASPLQHRQGWLPVSDASSPTPMDHVHACSK